MQTKVLEVPELALILLVGSSGSGKSTFAAQHFLPSEVVSSDRCRLWVNDDENDQSSTQDAFALLHTLVQLRLKRGRLTVVDATNLRQEDRQALVAIARAAHVLPVAIVFNIDEAICWERNQNREDRPFGRGVLKSHRHLMRQTVRSIRKKEGFTRVYFFDSPESLEPVQVQRTRLWNNRKDETGPFDIIGDIHGCFDELIALIKLMDYEIQLENGCWTLTHPANRKLVFVGDLVDRGPKSPEVLHLVMDLVGQNQAICVNGNHDEKLSRYLAGRNVKIAHGLEQTIEQLQSVEPDQITQFKTFLSGLVSHYVLDEGRLVVCHAGIREEFIGRGSPQIRQFCLYGDTTGEIDEFGLPVRYPWANDYNGSALIVYGHTPVPEVDWVNNTVNLDTGCVFGGRLTALRYPEKSIVSIPAQKTYYEPLRPIANETTNSVRNPLDWQALTGFRHLQLGDRDRVGILPGQLVSAAEVLARFSVDPGWLIYLPPTMSPCETAPEGPFLERPQEALAYYRKQEVHRVVCQAKHMGSRAIVVLARDPTTAAQKFAISEPKLGCVYTRTGRPFFLDPLLERSFLERLHLCLNKAGWWDLNPNWYLLDCEILPWSAKAQSLLEQQYAPVGLAAKTQLEQLKSWLEQSITNGLADVSQLVSRTTARLAQVEAYTRTYQGYCWQTNQLQGYRVAPFHILAQEGSCHFDKPHSWHLHQIDRLVEKDPDFIQSTERLWLDLNEPGADAKATEWWSSLLERGGEGMVVKPENFWLDNGKFLTQPAIKCRGKDYLRIIYGPEYDSPDHLERLRKRGLVRKRKLAEKESRLGHYALHQFVANGPWLKVQQAVLAILALESEPLDPRL
ncbi:MAG: polynucleotide kinase-phosphatase [Acidobacteria bacterium]|nr:polynucleotide kinase-phosphatase [Acidobacteriota bacterium]